MLWNLILIHLNITKKEGGLCVLHTRGTQVGEHDSGGRDLVPSADPPEEPGTPVLQVGRVHPGASEEVLLHYGQGQGTARRDGLGLAGNSGNHQDNKGII